MARRVSRKRKRKAPETALTPEDYQFPGEKRIYWEGVGGLIGITLFLAWDVLYFMVGPPVNNAVQPDAPLYGKWWIPLIMVAYPLVTWFVAQWLATRGRRRQLKEAGMSARVLNKSHPKLKAVLAEQAKLLGIDEPEMYIIPDDTPYIFTMPGKKDAIIATNTLIENMTDEEIATLIAREMGHIKTRHVRMAFTLRYLRRANTIIKVLLFPITLLSLFLGNWLELIEVTADRVAVLVTGRPALLNEAIVKEAVIADRESEITPEELDAFLKSGTDIATDAAQIERHYKMGEFLSKHRALRDRIEEIREYLTTPEGQQAAEKFAEIRQKLA